MLPEGVILPSFTLSETVNTDGRNSNSQTAVSGNVSYDQISARRSFSLRYGGGGLFSTNNSQSNNSYHNLSVTQSFAMRRWTFTLGDTLSYLPNAPVGGGVGIPGLGQFSSGLSFSNLNPGLLPSQSILAFNTTSLNNSSFGQAQYSFTRRTSATATASYGLLRYLDNSVLNGHQMVFSTGLNHTMGHSQAALQYSYSRFSYDTLASGMETHTAQLMYSRVLARDFSAQVAIGPEIVHSRGFGSGNRVSESGSAGVNYSRKRNSAALQYVRGVNGGSGLLQGSATNRVDLSVGHHFRVWSASANGSYMRSSGITQNARTIARSAGLQVNRTLLRTMSAYFSYTYVMQGAGNLCAAGTCAFQGDEHVFGLGLNWSPRGWRVNR